MKIQCLRARARLRQSSGFALIISLSLMVLLVVLAVGLLTLSAVSLRGSDRDRAASQARANARMALMMAIGDLQKTSGEDTRVTARAEILNSDNPPVLGVWRSWEGSDHDSQGRPISPGNYETKKQGRFLRWLVSGENPKSLPTTDERPGSVTLIGRNSVGRGEGRDKLQVHLEPQHVDINGHKGAFAWWIGGENQKARLPKPVRPENDTPSRWSVFAKSHGVADPTPLRMEEVLADPEQASRAISLQSGDLISKPDDLKVSQEFFHDLSATSVGLLTNTATGGWRKDLSLATENWAQLPNSNLPFFRHSPNKDIFSSKPSSANATAPRSMLYPWASYRGGATDMPIYRHGPVTSWEYLKDYATLYKKISATSSGRNKIPSSSFAIDDAANAFNFLHRVRILPVVARVQWVFSHYASPVGAGGSPQYGARLLVSPVVTMWNPYSVEITSPSLSFSILKPLPVALQYTVNGSKNPSYNCLTAGSLNNTPSLSSSGALQYQISSGFILKPGETRVFSSVDATAIPANTTLPLKPGYRSGGGHYFEVKNSAGQASLGPGTATIKADAKFDTSYDDLGQSGVGIYLDMSIAGSRHLAYRMAYTPSVANDVYKPLSQLAETTLASASTNPVPFMSTVFGARMASKTHLPAKGFVQSSPLVNYTAMGAKDLAETTIARDYGGTNHPVNSPFDYSFIKHAPGGDSQLPNASDTTGRGYIVTGFNKADGLSRCVIAEIPVRPLASLGELQHLDLRYENPIPPFAFNLIGNSDASPLLPANAVVNSGDANLGTNLQHDDSYCANHLLFDDWFFSSIAPDPAHYGSGGKSLQAVYVDFVSGTAPLANRAYLPIPADSGLVAADPENAKKLYEDKVKKADGYRTIASRLEVEGMFNVNSTSVVAWRALLGHARNQRIPFIQESGTSWSVEASDETDHACGRFSIAGDTEAGKAGSSGSFPEATEFAGYRILDDEMIDQLAEEIVHQVRMRGPFLSLAEFVNRQLSSGEPALAGAVQAALNEVSKGNSNPFAEIETVVGPPGKATASPPKAAEAGYRHPAAAEGWNAYGLPGWTRQADILRPLAPILSVRDDTFVIRAYGDSRDDKGAVVSQAVCEAVVRRKRDYVSAADAADTLVAPKSEVNKTFGRRFEVVSFRWLNSSEI